METTKQKDVEEDTSSIDIGNSPSPDDINSSMFETEKDILVDSRVKQLHISDYSMVRTSNKDMLYIKVESEDTTEYYRTSISSTTDARDIVARLENGMDVKKTLYNNEPTIKLGFSDVPEYIFEKVDQYHGHELYTQLYETEFGVEATVTDLDKDEDYVTVTVESVDKHRYTFDMTVDDYASLVESKGGGTLHNKTLYLTINRNAYDFSDFAIENEDSIILANEFEISDFYPINQFGLTNQLTVFLFFLFIPELLFFAVTANIFALVVLSFLIISPYLTVGKWAGQKVRHDVERFSTNY